MLSVPELISLKYLIPTLSSNTIQYNWPTTIKQPPRFAGVFEFDSKHLKIVVTKYSYPVIITISFQSVDCTEKEKLHFYRNVYI